MDEKDLRLDMLMHEVKGMREARDDALCANDELLAAHQKEHAVSLKDVFRFAIC